jgi:hypothetical protein
MQHWIKMDTQLAKHPRVRKIARRCGIPRVHAVGCLHAIWSMADQFAHEEEGTIDAIAEDIDEEAGVDGFAAAMIEAGWLEEIDEETMRFPSYHEHNGSTAKRRAVENKRKAEKRLRNVSAKCPQHVRNMSASVRTERGTREEERREEKRLIQEPPLSPPTPSDRDRMAEVPADAGGAAEVDPRLLELVDRWNAMKPEIVAPGNGARRTPQPAKNLVTKWRAAMRNRELREHLADFDRLFDAIREANYCHRQGWFTLPWLLSKNAKGEYNAERVLAGAHRKEAIRGSPKPVLDVAALLADDETEES